MAKPGAEKNPKSLISKVLPTIILVLLAIGVLLYPVIVTQLNNIEQRRVAEQYSSDLDMESHDDLAERFASAQRYNEERSQGPILDPWLARITEDNVAYQAYLDELDTHDVMARLVVPSASVDLPVYHGTGEEVLGKGVGHLYGSDLPVGGLGTHSILTAHTGLTNATLFDNLDDVVEGESIYISVAGEKLKYKVTDIRVVLPHETDTLRPEIGKDQLTLITCTPYGINTHRLLVTGERVEMDPDEEGDIFTPSGMIWTWWMYALAITALLIALLTVRWLRSMARKHNQRFPESPVQDNERQI
ncbi:fimbrial protein [Corynebacterium stationis]|uniref:class C sortase n=1 Tax=Corynebacterium stationis TaxID=1705 RepID=UPI000950815E|nr:class C sortase [Corynebacterium stationis]APT95936.1 fimbrial protein [Corynebacterium stationis]